MPRRHDFPDLVNLQPFLQLKGQQNFSPASVVIFRPVTSLSSSRSSDFCALLPQARLLEPLGLRFLSGSIGGTLSGLSGFSGLDSEPLRGNK